MPSAGSPWQPPRRAAERRRARDETLLAKPFRLPRPGAGIRWARAKPGGGGRRAGLRRDRVCPGTRRAALARGGDADRRRDVARRRARLENAPGPRRRTASFRLRAYDILTGEYYDVAEGETHDPYGLRDDYDIDGNLISWAENHRQLYIYNMTTRTARQLIEGDQARRYRIRRMWTLCTTPTNAKYVIRLDPP